MAHILVTGGTGNIGMYAVAEFLRRGHDVTVLDQTGDAPMLKAIAPDAEIIAGDILDIDLISRIVKERKVSRILHLAAFLGPESVTYPIKALDVNCRGTANIFDVALAMGVERVTWTSSIAALGTLPDYDGTPVDESYRIAPTTTYGASKYYGELMTPIYRQRGLDATCVRAAFAFGLGKLSGSWGANYNRIIYNTAVGRPSVFPSWARTGVQMIYNKDQAKFCVDATLASPGENWLFNTPTEQAFSEDDVIAILRAIVPDCDIVRDSAAPFGSAFPPNVDGSRALAEIPYKPDYTVKAAIAEMIEYYRKNPEQGI